MHLIKQRLGLQRHGDGGEALDDLRAVQLADLGVGDAQGPPDAGVVRHLNIVGGMVARIFMNVTASR